MFIECSYAYRIPKNTRNTWRLAWFRYETFIYLFELNVLWHEERVKQFLTMLTVRLSSALNSLTQTTHGHPVDLNWSPLAQIKNRRPSSSVESKLTIFFFFQITKSSAHRFRSWRHSHPKSYSLSGFFIVTSVIVTSSPRAREHLHSMCVPN